MFVCAALAITGGVLAAMTIRNPRRSSASMSEVGIPSDFGM
jgi:hypothetical protein